MASKPAACGGPWPCVCDVCTLTVGLEHKLADRRCGRSWTCGCANCQRSRKLVADWHALTPERRASIRRREAVLNVMRELEPATPNTPGKQTP